MESTADRDERVMPAGEREAFVRLACETDDGLYQEIAETLDWEVRMGDFLKKPLTALTVVSRPFEPGTVVEGRFEIVRVIGEGGMGVVYEAIDRKRNQRIAIKSAKPGFQRLLSPELEGALKVRHSNICLVNQIHTTKPDDGVPRGSNTLHSTGEDRQIRTSGSSGNRTGVVRGTLGSASQRNRPRRFEKQQHYFVP